MPGKAEGMPARALQWQAGEAYSTRACPVECSFSCKISIPGNSCYCFRAKPMSPGRCYSTGVKPFFKKVSHKAPLTHKEGGAFLFCLPHEDGA